MAGGIILRALLISTHGGTLEPVGGTLLGLGLVVALSLGRLTRGDGNGGLRWIGGRLLISAVGGALGLVVVASGGNCDGVCTGPLTEVAGLVGAVLLVDGVWDRLTPTPRSID